MKGADDMVYIRKHTRAINGFRNMSEDCKATCAADEMHPPAQPNH